MKRIIAWILSVTMILSLFPIQLIGATATAIANGLENSIVFNSKSDKRQSGNWIYSIISHGVVSIEGYTGDITSLKIPVDIDGYSVGVIASHAFESQKRLTSVTIPTQVFSIGSDAFYAPSNMTVTGYDGSTGLLWAAQNGAKVNSLTEMYLNSGVIDLTGAGNAARKTSADTMTVNMAMSYALEVGDIFFFGATDKYGKNYWGGRVTGIQRHDDNASVTFEKVEPRIFVDKIIASSDMDQIQMEFIPDDELMVYTDDGDVVSAAKWDIHLIGDIWASVSDKKTATLIDKTIDVFGLPVKITSKATIDFSCYYDPNLWSEDVAAASINFDVTTDITASKEVHIHRSKPLGKVVIFGVDGFGLTIPIDLIVDANANIEIKIKDVVSINWNFDSRKNSVPPKLVPQHSTPVSNVSVTGDIKIGLAVGVAIEACFERIVYLGVEGGIHGIANVTMHSLLVDKLCIDLELRLYIQGF